MNNVCKRPEVDQILESQSGNGKPNLILTKEKSPSVTIEEVNRVLDVGRLLLSVLTEEELEELKRFLKDDSWVDEIGNAGVT
jgi:hypothetical protein